MHASRALTPTERRISTVTFGVAPLLLAIVIVLLVTATPFGRTVDEGPLWLLGPIGVLVFAGLWFVVGPRAFGRPVLGAVCVAIATVAVATSIAFLPVLGALRGAEAQLQNGGRGGGCLADGTLGANRTLECANQIERGKHRRPPLRL